MTQLIESDATYQSNIRAAVRAQWSGVWGTGQFLNQMLLTFQRELPRAWAEGAAQCGITPADYSDEEKAALENIIKDEVGYAADFADYIAAHSKADGYALQPLFDRAAMWVLRREDVKTRAMLMSCGDIKLVWIYGDTQHCPSCAKLNGRVKRASQWLKAGVHPRKPPNDKIKCGGWRCQCRLDPTDLPVSKGPLPRLP